MTSNPETPSGSWRHQGKILLNEEYPVFVIDRKLTAECECEDCERWRERNRFQAGIMPPVDEELAASLL